MIDRQALIDAITRAVESSRPSPSAEKPEAAIDALQHCIENDPGLALLNNSLLPTGVGSFAHCNPYSIAMRLWAEAEHQPIHQLVKQIEDLVTTNNRSFVRLVMVTSGLEISKPLVIDRGLKLMPFKDLPASRNKDLFIKSRVWAAFSTFWFSSATDLPDHIACIVKRYRIDPLIVPKPDAHIRAVEPVRKQLLQSIRSLAAHESLAPVEIASWLEIENYRIRLVYSTGGGFSPGHGNPLGSGNFRLQQKDHQRIVEIVRSFQRMDEAERFRLTVPLEHLIRARRNRVYAEKAINIGIALESLLSDEGEQGEITHKISVRGARFSESSIKKRAEIRNLLKILYGLRSGAIHTGKLSDFVKIPGNRKYPTEKIQKDGTDVCGRLISKCLKLGHVPRWSEFDIS